MAKIPPIVLPSWRFFQTVAPSPRIEWQLLDQSTGVAKEWRIFAPRPDRVSVQLMLARLLWNPNWNEALYLVTCAERVAEDACEDAISAIHLRLAKALWQKGERGQFRFRLIFLSGVKGRVKRDVLFVSKPYAIEENT